jgi:hypothetical protein
LRRVVLILFALVVFVPSMARGSAWYRCAQDGETRSACCCPAAAKHHEAPAPYTEVRAACCCSITQITSPESSERAAPPITIDMAPAMVPVMIAMAPIETYKRIASVEYPQLQRGPPESLFARFCSLLL